MSGSLSDNTGAPPLTLDVVIPTYNRSDLLTKTVRSFAEAAHPAGLTFSLLIIDNNSPDNTAAVVRDLQASTKLDIRYIHEKKQGLSHARNAGIAQSTADWVGFIDDDEEIREDWLTVALRECSTPEVQFVGGPYLPNWVTPVPDWLPPGYPAVIGAIPPKPRSIFSKEFGANLMGGNAIVRRDVFERVGMYSPRLGRSKRGLLSEEDAEFYRRLEAAGIHGVYVPDLAIYHYIAPDRLTRKYHRRWVLWRAVSQGLLDRERPLDVRYFAGVPRYKLGEVLRSLLTMPLHWLRKKGKARAFANELTAWDLAGFVYGKYFFRADAYYAEDAG